MISLINPPAIERLHVNPHTNAGALLRTRCAHSSSKSVCYARLAARPADEPESAPFSRMHAWT